MSEEIENIFSFDDDSEIENLKLSQNVDQYRIFAYSIVVHKLENKQRNWLAFFKTSEHRITKTCRISAFKWEKITQKQKDLLARWRFLCELKSKTMHTFQSAK